MAHSYLKNARVLLAWLVAGIVLTSPISNAWASCIRPAAVEVELVGDVLWHGDIQTWPAGWGQTKFQFGAENVSVINEPGGQFSQFLRVTYPENSIDPGSAGKGLAPLGGAQFTSRLDALKGGRAERIVLSYSVRFADGFYFVKGGKLPGLYGGIPRSGGRIPTGSDGFSTRIVWQTYGQGALYAYLPTSHVWGTLFGRGAWNFKTGQWMRISQLVKLNDPAHSDGEVSVWINGNLVHHSCGLQFRNVPTLTTDGLFFSTFFGGNDTSWASPVTTHADFADFRIMAVR